MKTHSSFSKAHLDDLKAFDIMFSGEMCPKWNDLVMGHGTSGRDSNQIVHSKNTPTAKHGGSVMVCGYCSGPGQLATTEGNMFCSVQSSVRDLRLNHSWVMKLQTYVLRFKQNLKETVHAWRGRNKVVLERRMDQTSSSEMWTTDLCHNQLLFFRLQLLFHMGSRCLFCLFLLQ